AIMTGKLGTDGVFYADELQLKCPSKYESAVPAQTE
ncbi:MAG: cytochrome C biogenesis protein, partial [Candidatus Thermofonsia Clade 1 bacterium]